MNAILNRRNKLRIAEERAPEEMKEVYTKLYKIIHTNGQYSDYVDPLDGHDELRTNKEFAIQYISLYPEAYHYFSDELRANRDVLRAVASSPVYYIDQNQGKYGSYAISPLFDIVFEHLRRINTPSSKKSDTYKEDRSKGFPFVEEKNLREYKINDPELLLNGLKAELDSYEYIKEMEKNNGQNVPYKGLELLDKLIQGKNFVFTDKGINIYDENSNLVHFSEYNCLLSLRYAPDELLKDNEFRNQVKEIMQHWVQFKKEENKQLEYSLSSGIDNYMH